jgi:putative membrane protein
MEGMNQGNPKRSSRLLRARLKRCLPFVSMLLLISGIALFALNAEMGTSNPNLSAADREFLQKAVMAGMAEADLGRLAMQKGGNPNIKILGERMVADHDAINADFAKLAKKKGVELPSFLDEKHRAKVDLLANSSGEDFDKTYLNCMASMHGKDFAEFARAREHTADNDLKTVLDQALPVIQNHFENLRTLPLVSGN